MAAMNHLNTLLVAASLVVLGTAGCTTALSTMQPADTLKPGQWHAGAGQNLSVPVSRIVDAVDAAATIADKYASDTNYEPTEEEQRAYLRAVVGLALNAPGVNSDFMLRYGLADKFDAGLRWTTTGVHVDGKFQFLDDESGWDGSLSLGISHHFFDGFVFDVLEYLKIDDFKRTNFEIPMIFGKKISDFGYFWGGPKYILSKYSVDAKLKNVAGLQSSDGTIHYFGAFAGAGVGYKKVYLFAELTVMNMVARPIILDEETDLGGIVIMPSVGAMARW